MNDCIFCKIVKGEAPSYTIWEDDKHMAFLTPYPNTEGFTVVVTKDHHSSYAFDLPDNILSELILAVKKVGKLLDQKLEDVGRTGMIFEGFGVNHIHAKLFPMHGTKDIKWQPLHSAMDKFFDKYEGYISSHDGKRADDAWLKEVANKIIN